MVGFVHCIQCSILCKSPLGFADRARNTVWDAGPTLALDETASETEVHLELQCDRARGAVRHATDTKNNLSKPASSTVCESQPAAWLASAWQSFEHIHVHVC